MLVVLGLGGNIGNVPQRFLQAIKELKRTISKKNKGTLLKIGPLLKTKPREVLDQPSFFNSAILICWHDNLVNLLDMCKKIEKHFGRERAKEQYKGPRTLDIDILFASDVIMNTTELTIPHPQLVHREFALAPLVDLLPNAKDPVNHRSYAEILENLEPQGIYYEQWEYYNAKSEEVGRDDGSGSNDDRGKVKQTEL
jgi:2-amino-4-hydroxy-6-hydroxymethyldihydropteridine diphosphokinase